MNPIALYLASGESLYTGALLLLLTQLASHYVKNKWLLRLRNLAAWAALAMILLACPPFSVWVYAVLIIAFLAWFIAWNRTSPTRIWRNTRLATAVLLSLLTVIVAAIEARHRVLPTISSGHQRLVIIGDSISAGIDAGDPWPVLFEKQTGMAVQNLSKPAIGTLEAIDLARTVADHDTLVLLEIGGNDLLSDLPAADFERQLAQTLESLHRPNRTLVMFELPLLPHKIAYGRIQRRLAAKYNVHLIPKRYFIHILSGADATSDGLHLSRHGAQRMANVVAMVLRKP